MDGRKKPFRFAANRLGPSASELDVYHLQTLLGRYGYLTGSYYPGSK